ncbi:MAG: 50S ribosomal protein L6, partial [Bacteroidetes bacterium RIFCSPLOWO2_02_FULL_36_8]
MSRIGNKTIFIPKNVQLELKDNSVMVKGPLGSLSQSIDPEIKVNIKDNQISITRPSDQKRHKSLHGTTRAQIASMVKGVSEGYKMNLELIGVGFKSILQGNVLDLSIGFSHNIMFQLPKEVKIKTEIPKGGNPTIYLECIDKQL